MRGTRWLLLVAIAAILGGSAFLYRSQKRSVAKATPQKPPELPSNTNATAINYQWAQSTGGFANVRVKAKGFRQVRDTPNYDLEDLELTLMHRDQLHYDLIKSAKAQFNQSEGRMYSEGDVEIVLDVPAEGKALHTLTTIKTSGVTFDSKNGKAITDRAAHFLFENGSGQCVGATYDPTTRELHLLKDSEMNLKGKGTQSKPMKVQAGEITYKESGSVIELSPWSRLIRAETKIDAAASTVRLKDGQLDTIDAQQARGVDTYPKRQIRYSADTLHVVYGESGEIEKISANGNARMHQDSEGGTTDTRSRVADLSFDTHDGESILQRVLAVGDAVVESQPAPARDGKRAESRVLKSETIETLMRPGGREIEWVKTHAPGTLEFLANAPDQHRRLLSGERMTIGYGERNLIRDFDSVHVTTVTFPAANNKSKSAAPGKTASDWLKASFDARGQLATMKQGDNFTYEEGERRARSVTATLDQAASAMDLQTGARVWDTSGSTDADRIHLLQKTGDFIADGHVMTSRMPDADPKKKAGAMLEGDEPIQGTAPHMTSANHNKLVHYEGGSVVWQGADRIEGQVIDIDREKHSLSANGKVSTQFLDQGDAKDDSKEKDAEARPAGARIEKGARPEIVRVSDKPVPQAGNKPPVAPVYTVVTGDTLVYTDPDRLAHYTGNVSLTRPGLSVKSDELRAFLNPKDSGEDSRLNRAVNDGKVEIVESRPERQRIGKGDHGEYFTSEDKVILRGAPADLYDSIKHNESHGAELTYFTSDDRLLIGGAPAKPVSSRLQRKTRPIPAGKTVPNAHPGNR